MKKTLSLSETLQKQIDKRNRKRAEMIARMNEVREMANDRRAKQENSK